MDDCEHTRELCTTLPPRRIRFDLTLEQMLGVIRTDYGLPPHTPVLTSERGPAR
jgi:hypothetical protein